MPIISEDQREIDVDPQIVATLRKSMTFSRTTVTGFIALSQTLVVHYVQQKVRDLLTISLLEAEIGLVEKIDINNVFYGVLFATYEKGKRKPETFTISPASIKPVPMVVSFITTDMSKITIMGFMKQEDAAGYCAGLEDGVYAESTNITRNISSLVPIENLVYEYGKK